MNRKTHLSLPKFVFFLLCLLLLIGCPGRQTVATMKELNVYNWDLYIGETTIQDFEREYNVKVNYDNFSSNEEMLAKIQTGGSKYDVIVASDYMVKSMLEQKLLDKIDLKNISNISNVDPAFLKLPFDPDNNYSIPYQWGTTGIGVNKSKVKEEIIGWDILWNDKYKGRITMLDDIRFGMVPALKKSGFSINTTDVGEIQQAKDLMLKQKPLIKAYTSSTYIDMLKSGDTWIAYGFSGDIFQVAKDNPDVEYVIPSDGTNIWVDNMCIPKSAPHKETAELFINYILRPDVSAGISNYTKYSSPNKEAKSYINADILNNPKIYPPKELLDKCEFMRDLGPATKLYDTVWNEIKAK